MPKAFYKFASVGKRKTAVARVYMNPGKGNWEINERGLEDYFPTRSLQTTVNEAFETTGTAGQFDVKIRVVGGGVTGQADAVRHGIARALLRADVAHRPKLKTAGLLTRDSRKKERKKYGQPGARKRFQYSKR
ncbi:MAG TPA: 30S ribosomal protein S9 [Bdellovibrionota bacterium]|nr:30S ribosomal protein S9 [Bdellovibrionota bacterium]